jgi:hypothetical protein
VDEVADDEELQLSEKSVLTELRPVLTTNHQSSVVLHELQIVVMLIFHDRWPVRHSLCHVQDQEEEVEVEVADSVEIESSSLEKNVILHDELLGVNHANLNQLPILEAIQIQLYGWLFHFFQKLNSDIHHGLMAFLERSNLKIILWCLEMEPRHLLWQIQ